MIKKLKDICSFKTPRRNKYKPGVSYKIADVTAIDINRLSKTSYKTTNDTTNLVNKNDIVMISFDYTGEALGYTFYIDKDNEYVAGIDTIILTNCSVDAKALSMLLMRKDLRKQILSKAVTTITTSKRISPKDIENIEIDMEMLNDCSRSLKAFEKINDCITYKTLSIQEVEKVYKTVEKKIFLEIKSYKKMNISDVCEFKAGSIDKPKNISEDITEKNNIPVISGNKKIKLYTNKANTPKKYVLYNTIGGRVGDAFYVDYKSYAINKMLIIESKKINLEFLAFQLSFFKPGIEGDGVRKFVSLQNFAKTEIYVPSKAKQEKFAYYLNTIKTDIENRNKEIDNLILLRDKILNGGK